VRSLGPLAGVWVRGARGEEPLLELLCVGLGGWERNFVRKTGDLGRNGVGLEGAGGRLGAVL
jgi:hypothetical protein